MHWVGYELIARHSSTMAKENTMKLTKASNYLFNVKDITGISLITRTLSQFGKLLAKPPHEKTTFEEQVVKHSATNETFRRAKNRCLLQSRIYGAFLITLPILYSHYQIGTVSIVLYLLMAFNLTCWIYKASYIWWQIEIKRFGGHREFLATKGWWSIWITAEMGE